MKITSLGALGLSLFLSGCSLNPATPTPTPNPSAVMEKQIPTISPEATKAMMIKPGDISGATLINGKVVVMGKNGAFEILTQKEIMVGSAKVTMEGKIIGRDGSSKMLEEGMMVDTQGMVKASTTQMILDAKRNLMIPQDESGKLEPGAYQDYSPAKLAMAETGKVILFFKASWCPTCNAANADIIKNLSSIPGDVRILRVDYDNSEDLKKKYGVTSQHTFIRVDATGKELKRWLGSPTLSDILAKSA